MNQSFCYIAPTEYLDFTTASKTHLVLAHLVDTDDKYAEFYNYRSKAGDYIMMDNSAYELKTPYSPDKLIELGKKINANAIVLPDYPFEHSSKTISAAEKFIPQFKKAGFQTFFVPQSKTGDLEDWINCYKWAIDNKDIDIIGMSILGIPNALSNIDPSYARVVITQLLIDRKLFDVNRHHHYLGLNAGPNLEIRSLLKMTAKNWNQRITIDSSGPIWSAILGHQYTTNCDSYLSVSKPKLPVNFSIKRTTDSETLKRISDNIKLTQSIFNTYNQNQVWYANE